MYAVLLAGLKIMMRADNSSAAESDAVHCWFYKHPTQWLVHCSVPSQTTVQDVDGIMVSAWSVGAH